MRALWTAATGMKTQQFNIDTIANNLSNVNTTSYKTQRAEFKDLFYTSLKRNNMVDEEGRPVNLQVGHGSMATGTRKDYTQGSFIETGNDFDLAIDGEGFFAIRMPNGDIRYTRDGNFKLSVDDNGGTLVTSEGYLVLDENNNRIRIGRGIDEIEVDYLGYIRGMDEDENSLDLGRLKLVNFANPEGLLSQGLNLYSSTAASGRELPIAADQMTGRIAQRYLESSNVQVIDEMVKMITAQRAYEINSKAIHTSDEMLQLANNLKR